ncbi:isopeptide-forming domain-containing fimbrial protein [Lysinibacillus agricola]|uniref:Isopeptide-forming domain-containing fimbrial protein n=1 Tax=Lysinibacillus agricola TaxID=2590012 RepID=A0ABX7AUK8_9BACI|nr:MULTISPECIES: SpaA isopeptide-forming pilin-related protein [Lysinibacillus]KOS60013.1 adhesin [Lysinibacillus sp. FJAT-14222]QQP12947.1 isopeptide-forming domain-containing fimbrial protein [Lysinibacillus agricola]
MKKTLRLLLAFVVMFATLPGMFAKAATPTNGTLTIHKYEQEKNGAPSTEGDGSANQTIPTDAKALPGVTFEIKQIMSFNKISNDGKIAEESVTPVTNATPIKVTTDADGQAVFKDLPLGRYEVKEVSGPPHINLNPNTYTVDIPMTSKNGDVLNYDVHMYPKNEIKRGAVELTKKGAEGKDLAGAEFTLFKADGTAVKTGLTTGTNGKIRAEGLEYGDYYFQEIKAPTGYVLDSTKYPFSIQESGTINADGTIKSGVVVPVEITNYLEPTIDKKINNDLEFLPINPLKDYNYDIKTLIPEDIKDYKNYAVTDTLDDRLTIQGTPVVTIDGVAVDASVVEVTVDGQKVTATVKDFSKLDGKKELHLQIKSQIKEETAAGTEIPNTAAIDFTNKNDITGNKETNPVIVTPTAGSIQLTKVDGADGKTLAGAEFELRDNGKVVVLGGQPVKGVSDVNGLITWNNIPYGDYQIVETKAPTYIKDDGTTASYQQLRDPIDVTINADHQKIELDVKNNKSGWYLPSTGGMGTILFSIVGIVLMAAATFVFFRRKTVNN